MNHVYHPPRSDEAAWAAGIFEGEGSIVLGGSAKVILKISMTDEDVVRRVSEILECGHVNGPYMRQNRPDHKVIWEWRASRQADVIHVLSLLLPYLGKRRKKRALQALAVVTPALARRIA